MSGKVVKTDEEWREILTPEEYRISRQKGTEQAFTGEYYNFKGKGIYLCMACGNELFSSETKFEFGTGWPSFWAPVEEKNVSTERDMSHGMIRTELKCSRCDAHLGHIFKDGALSATGLRYCVNSASLDFVEKKK